MFYKRYGQIEFFKQMELSEAKNFLRWLLRQQIEEELWQRWIAGYQQVMSFESFKKDLRTTKPINKGKEEILADVNSIIAMMNGTKGGEKSGSI